MTFPFSRPTSHELPHATAEQILANVFSTCGREPNSVPLEALTSYSNYRKERYALQRSIILMMLVLFLLLPLLFICAGIQVSSVQSDTDENPTYSVTIDTIIPIRQVEANLDGYSVPLQETTPGVYTARPLHNGALSIAVTLINRQETVTSVQIEGVDTTPPTLLSSSTTGNAILLYVSDTGCGIDYAAITVTDERGNAIQPLNSDPESGCISLPYPQQIMYVSIPDLRGNALSINLRPQD